MIDERIIKLALDFLLKFPDEGMNILNSDLCMPNIPFPTMGCLLYTSDAADDS